MALGVKLPIIQVVGYQNSGKTTLMKKLIHELSTIGYKVGTIKHHGHGGEPELGDAGKDTQTHRQAGARVVAVEGDGALHLTSQNDWTLHKILSLYECMSLDIILIEGYKSEHYPKIVLVRNHNDVILLQRLTNIFCVILVEKVELLEMENYCIFLRSEEEAYLSYIMKEVRGDLNE